MSQGAVTLAQLKQAIPSHASMIERDLYALYLTRVISTQAYQGTQGNSTASYGHSDLGRSSPWILDRLSRSLKTVSDELRPLF
jgi:biotin synthase-related radical SAM superfamily protein